jgi:thymidine phosphorylase
VTGRDVVTTMLDGGDEAAMGRLIAAARSDEFADGDIADLASGLAASGARIACNSRAADVASTGGPSSLSTLLCPLQLRARGLIVPKLGVPGRPAGGIDVLQTLPGYQAALEPDAASAALEHSGYVHLLADERWVPLDARLFAYRQRVGAQTVPALVVASILAKKLAAGAMGAGLEIRIAPHGNFGADPEDARRNARRYNAVGRLLGLRPVCVLTDASRPYQPYIGRGEALLAVAEILDGRAQGWLAEHQLLCERMADAVATALGIDTTAEVPLAALRRGHDELLRVHGADATSFDDRVEAIRAAPRTIVRARRAGVVDYDLGKLRDTLVARQRMAAAQSPGATPDPAGVVLEAPAGVRVEVDAPLMSIRVPEGEHALATELAACIDLRQAKAIEDRATSTLEVI